MDVNSVSKGTRVRVEYVAKVDGKVVDKSEGNGPLEFIAGTGEMIQGFDEAVLGMKLGQEKTVTVPPEKAYGTSKADHPLGGKTMVFWIKVVGIG
ncbi:MAG: FKBP-type peptidyl-prolyl cis-trans isomerase [Candidatus Micrarchaeota archaeon]|nr:FKBP-type peptidyl-prolyl cis-trans isomerase [Candidatus Micrarchaeota archaeon]